MERESATYNEFMTGLLEQVVPAEALSKPIAPKLWSKYLPISVGIAVLITFIFTINNNYLVVQTLTRILALIVVSNTFLIAWNCRKFLDNTYFIFLATAYFFGGCLDLLYTLTYVKIFVPSGFNIACQLWVAARYLESISLIIAPYFIARKLAIEIFLSGYSIVTFLAIRSIFVGNIFPDCYIQGVGVTRFTHISNLFICLMLIAALALLVQKYKHFETYILQLLSFSLLLAIGCQLLSIFGFLHNELSNKAIDVLNVFLVYVNYKSIVYVGLLKPQKFLANKLKSQERDLYLAAEELKLEGLRGHNRLLKYQQEISAIAERLGLALEADKISILDLDIEDNEIIWLQGYDKLNWFKPGKFDFNDPAFEEWIYSEDREVTKQIIKRAKLERQDYEHLFRVNWSDGSIHWLQTKGKFYDRTEGEGKKERMTICFVDITAQKQAELALEKIKNDLETQVAYRTRELVQLNDDLQRQLSERKRIDKSLKDQVELLNLAHDAIVARDLNGAIAFWNHGAQEIYGFTKQEALGKKIHVLLKTQFPKPLVQIEAELFANGRWEGELIHTKRDGTQIIVSSRWAVKQDLQDRPLEILEINSDITLAKQTEESLLSTSVRLAGILDIAEDAIISIDENQKITLFNQGAEKIFGYTAIEILGKPLNILLPTISTNNESTDSGILTNYKSAQIGKENLIFGVRKNGITFPLEASLSELELVTGTIYTLILRDITERMKAEENLSEREERFRKVFEEGPLGMAIIGLDYRMMSVNPMMCQMLGYSEEQITGSNFIDLTHPGDLQQEMSLIEQLASGNISHYKIDKRYIKKNKDIIWGRLTVSIVRDTAEKPLYFLAMLEDVTEQKQAEETLRHREAEFRASIENAPDAIVRYDRQLYCQYINPEIERQLGIPPKAFIGKLISEVGFTPEFVNLWQQALHKVFATGRQESIEFEWTALTGQAYYQARMVPEFSGEGTVEFVLAIIRNITEIKQAQKELEEANERLKKWVEELAFRNREIVLLGKMSDILQACISIEEAYRTLAQLVKPLFPDVEGGIFVMNASKDLVEVVASWCGNDNISAFNSKKIFAPNECWALRRGRPHLVQYSEISLQCKHIQIPDGGESSKEDELETETIGTEGEMANCNADLALPISSIYKLSPIPAETLCVPMMAQGEALGVLYLSSLEPGKLTLAKEQLAVTVAEHIGLALANLKLQEELKQQSIRDSLTGLYNRRYLEESLAREINRGLRLKQPLGVIMIDVDRFKRYNDTYGHEAGDVVLREIGTFLQEKVRGSDIACRYGGEELTLILPEATLETTLKRAEFLREGIKHLNLQYHHQQLGGITVSLGVAVFPEHGLTGESVIAAADAALYEAKKQGRDRVVVAQ